MNVELGLKLGDGKDVTIKYRALNLGTGKTWDGLKSGQLARPFPKAELTTGVALKVGGTASVPAGTHRLYFVGSTEGMSLQIGGSRDNPGPRVCNRALRLHRPPAKLALAQVLSSDAERSRRTLPLPGLADRCSLRSAKSGSEVAPEQPSPTPRMTSRNPRAVRNCKRFLQDPDGSTSEMNGLG